MAKKSKFADRWPGVIERKKPSGIKLYYRFKAGGEKALPFDMESEEFAAAYEACRLVDAAPAAEKKAKEPTFADAWLAYKASDYYVGLSARTQSRHRYYADTFLDAKVKGQTTLFKEVPIGSPEAELLPLLRAYISKAPADLPYRTACLLRHLFAIATEQEVPWCLRNLGNDLDVAKPKSKGGRKKWLQWMLDQFERVHQGNDMAMATYGLARFLGNRRGDVALLRWDRLKIEHVMVDDEIEEEWTFNFNQQKGGTEMWLPVPDELKLILQRPALEESRTNGGTIIKNEWGVGFTVNSLGNKFFDWCDDADIPEGYTMHGLRANFAVELYDVTGGDLSLVQRGMGHQTPTTTNIYLKDLVGNEDTAAKIRAARKAHKERNAQILEFTRKKQVTNR